MDQFQHVSRIALMLTEEKTLTENQSRVIIGLDDAKRLREEILRYRRENLRQAQRALEISKILDLIIEPRGRE
jgi:hypothetical protein